jgi:hypothetical protein
LITDGGTGSGSFGGNILTLPGGICVLGKADFKDDKAWSGYADQFCAKDPARRIQAPTSWLSVGHTDEVLKVIPNFNQKQPCDFSLVVASPKKAMKLLRENPNALFFDKIQLSFQYKWDFSGIKALCTSYHKHRELLAGRKWVEDTTSDWDTVAQKMDAILKSCQTITNGEVIKIMESDLYLKDYNDLVQKNMDAFKLELETKLKGKLPSCKIDFIDVPDLFAGAVLSPYGSLDWHPIHSDKGDWLPDGTGFSILPNPTNSVSVNKTIISPEPYNSLFKAYITKEYGLRGLKPEYVDTLQTHRAMGNLHCISHAIPICRPK